MSSLETLLKERNNELVRSARQAMEFEKEHRPARINRMRAELDAAMDRGTQKAMGIEVGPDTATFSHKTRLYELRPPTPPTYSRWTLRGNGLGEHAMLVGPGRESLRDQILDAIQQDEDPRD